MEVTDKDKDVIKLILKKLESIEIMVNITLRPNNGELKREIRAFSPNGQAVGMSTKVMSETDDLLGASITSLLTIDAHKLIRNQNE